MVWKHHAAGMNAGTVAPAAEPRTGCCGGSWGVSWVQAAVACSCMHFEMRFECHVSRMRLSAAQFRLKPPFAA